MIRDAGGQWCVYLDRDGKFKHARQAASGPIAWTLEHWRELDAAAAEQFIVPDQRQRECQHAFIAACGMGQTAQTRVSMSDALTRFGGR